MVAARDRSGQTIDFVAGRGALTADALHTGLLPTLQTAVIPVGDADAAYRCFATKARIAHEWVDPKKGVRSRRSNTGEAIHVQNVNSYHSRFKNWLRHFHGVATCYPDNYLGWQRAIAMGRIANSERFLRAALEHFDR